MKKIILFLLAACFIFSLCSCGDMKMPGKTMTVREIAEAVIKSEKAMREYNIMEVQSSTDYFPGLTAQPIGYEEAVQFSSPMTPPPNVGYVFRLSEDADVAAFKKQLEDNADKGWAICVFADTAVIESCENYVLFALYAKGGDITEATEGKLKTAFKNCF